jgi:hypothetical protein
MASYTGIMAPPRSPKSTSTPSFINDRITASEPVIIFFFVPSVVSISFCLAKCEAPLGELFIYFCFCVIFIPTVPQIKAVWGFSSHPHDSPQKMDSEKLAFIVFTQHSLKGKRFLVNQPYRTFVGRAY